MSFKLEITGFGQGHAAGKTMSWFEVRLLPDGEPFKIQVPNEKYDEFNQLVMNRGKTEPEKV